MKRLRAALQRSINPFFTVRASTRRVLHAPRRRASGSHAEAVRLLRGATQLQRRYEAFLWQAGPAARRLRAGDGLVHVARSTVCDDDERGLFASVDLPVRWIDRSPNRWCGSTPQPVWSRASICRCDE